MRGRKDKISHDLNWLQDHGVIDGWTLQGNMPGHRWTLWGRYSSGRSYTTLEVESFIEGASAGLQTGTLLGAGASAR